MEAIACLEKQNASNPASWRSLIGFGLSASSERMKVILNKYKKYIKNILDSKHTNIQTGGRRTVRVILTPHIWNSEIYFQISYIFLHAKVDYVILFCINDPQWFSIWHLFIFTYFSHLLLVV